MFRAMLCKPTYLLVTTCAHCEGSAPVSAVFAYLQNFSLRVQNHVLLCQQPYVNHLLLEGIGVPVQLTLHTQPAVLTLLSSMHLVIKTMHDVTRTWRQELCPEAAVWQTMGLKVIHTQQAPSLELPFEVVRT